MMVLLVYMKIMVVSVLTIKLKLKTKIDRRGSVGIWNVMMEV